MRKKNNRQNKKVNRNLLGIIIIIEFLGFDLSSGLFVVLGTAGRSARMCVCCTQWRASNLSNIFRSRYPPDSSINRSFTDIFLFRCVYRDGNGI